MPDVRGTFSVVSALYQVERYLSEFLASLESQTYGFERLDVVLVDDGSTDGTFEHAQRWAAQHPNVRVVRQENAGPASARNHGLELVRNRWVTFTDPDDVLAPDYFERLDAFMRSPEGTGAALYATRLEVFREADGTREFSHALDGKFTEGDRAVDLSQDPSIVQASGASSVLDVELLRSAGLRFEEGLRPNFEDVHLLVRYLLAAPAPVVGVVASAVYVYRKRDDGTSALQNLGSDARPITTVLEHGYLDLLDRAQDADGSVPAWVQNVLIYTLSWILRSSQRIESPYAGLGPEVGERFATLARRVCARLDEDVVRRYDVHRLNGWVRAAVRLRLGEGEGTLRVRTGRVRGDLVEVTYYFAGTLPEERLEEDGRVVEPASATVRQYEFLGQVLLTQRILWVPAGRGVTLHLDGRAASVLLAPGRRTRTIVARQVQAEAWTALSAAEAALLPRAGRKAWSEAHPGESLETPSFGERVRTRGLGDTWVLMDRVGEAGDNAEAFYRWIRENRPRTDLRFVLDRTSSDWVRLDAEGFRLVAYASAEHRDLQRHARVLVSSQAREEVVQPFDPEVDGGPAWRVVFLQHGVAKGDLSRWFNQKDFALVLASAAPEARSFDGESPYRLTPMEVTLTPQPRLHELTAADAARSGPPRRVLVAPTWRRWLSERTAGEAAAQQVADSAYVRHWTELLRHPELLRTARERGLVVTFLPHPNAREAFADVELPGGVEVVTEVPVRYRDLLVDSAVLVTDYSSVTFDLAWLGRPTVYFQFDEAEFFGGRHNERRGWFDYRRDGFGPVVDGELADVCAAIATALDADEPVAWPGGPVAEGNAELYDRIARLP